MGHFFAKIVQVGKETPVHDDLYYFFSMVLVGSLNDLKTNVFGPNKDSERS
jgi:hypothetical protein